MVKLIKPVVEALNTLSKLVLKVIVSVPISKPLERIFGDEDNPSEMRKVAVLAFLKPYKMNENPNDFIKVSGMSVKLSYAGMSFRFLNVKDGKPFAPLTDQVCELNTRLLVEV